MKFRVLSLFTRKNASAGKSSCFFNFLITPIILISSALFPINSGYAAYYSAITDLCSTSMMTSSNYGSCIAVNIYGSSWDGSCCAYRDYTSSLWTTYTAYNGDGYVSWKCKSEDAAAFLYCYRCPSGTVLGSQGDGSYTCPCSLSGSMYESCATGYEQIYNVDNNTCSYVAGSSYRCAAGYYGSPSSCSSGCTACSSCAGTGATCTSSAGATSCSCTCSGSSSNTYGTFSYIGSGTCP